VRKKEGPEDHKEIALKTSWVNIRRKKKSETRGIDGLFHEEGTASPTQVGDSL